MSRSFRPRWPDTVAGRAILILVAALLAFHFAGYWAYRVSVDSMANVQRDKALAERIVTIKRAIAGNVQDAERDRVAHDLSSASLEVHWSKVSLVLGTAPRTERTQAMAVRLKELAPELASESFRLGYADGGAPGTGEGGTGEGDAGEGDADRHMMLVSVRLDDGSWVNFSSTALGATQHADWNVLAIMICFGVAIIVIGVLLLRWATRPLRDLALAAERFSLDQAPTPLSEAGPAEVRRAARAFNTMGERIQRLVAERMQALAAVSHDLRTPITRLRLRSELMEDEATRDLVDADLSEMEAMIDSTLEFLRGGVSSEAIRPLDIVSVIETIVDDHIDQGRMITLGGIGHGRVLGRLLALKRAFWNVIGNAVKYGDQVSIAISETPAGLSFVIEDDGPGIPEHEVERAFQPFVRLEESRSRETGGTGLGLTIARAVIHAHGGEILIANRAEGGLRVTVTLPTLAANEQQFADALAAGRFPLPAASPARS
ncbi:Periplasmic sensor signal transduction histidine kinase [Bosea sp. LC85]|uniref:ATP-binding protein n=1 Tax=Bosea sp. LC85 TaxID=1502851 RepID=UPI0004E4360E|nr:ATP-binding protein [Bosea sp. LC85]KFC63734.1 Periplasmic sensor signal transduction histidine kinase [Bosea sp. LC85]